jgi:hypothetical protein
MFGVMLQFTFQTLCVLLRMNVGLLDIDLMQ